MSGIRMTHPGLPGQEYWADEGQVPHLQGSGWRPDPDQQAQGEVWPADAQRFEGQEQVRIRHPETGGETVVAASAVAVHQERGWQVVDELDGLTVEQLRDRARELGLPVSGTKAELLERLRTAQQQDKQQGEAGDEPAADVEGAEA